MTISSVTSTSPFNSTILAGQAATQPLTPAGQSSPGPASPPIINQVSGQISSGRALATTADIQEAVNGLNAAAQNVARFDWSKIPGITPAEIASAKADEAQHLQAAEGATIAFAGEQGISGVNFNFQSVGFAGGTAVPQASPPVASEIQTTSGPITTSSGAPESVKASSIVASGPSTSGSSVALSLLTAYNQQSPSQANVAVVLLQRHDSFA